MKKEGFQTPTKGLSSVPNVDDTPPLNASNSFAIKAPFAFESLKIVSMNLAACEPSAEAPRSWTPAHVAKVVRQELLQADPDVLALQECPRHPQEWAATYWDGYQLVGVASSHAFYVLLLVRDNIAPYTTLVSTLPTNTPAVMVKITDPQKDKRAIFVASCHLEPFREGAHKRSRQMKSMVDTAMAAAGSQLQHPLVIAGDTNMRWEEDEGMEQGGELQLLDAWKLAGADPTTKFTWDTRNQLESGGYFNRYYGDDTREYRTRYDRIYIAPLKTTKPPNKDDHDDDVQVSVESFALIANRPVNPPLSRTHFLSDHFGMTCELKLT